MSGTQPSVLVVVEQLRRTVPGGIGTYVRGLLAGLSEIEVDGTVERSIELFASRPSATAAGADPVLDLGRPLRTSRLSSRVLTRAWDLGVARAPGGFDVVHGVSLAAPAPRRAGRGRLVVMVHDLAWRTHPGSTTRRGRRWHDAALQRALHRADAFVVPSLRVRDELVAAGAGASTVTVIAEGADHLPEPDRSGTDAMLRAFGVEGPYLLSVSTLEPRKNLGRLVEAYRSARLAMAAPLPLVVAGPLGWGDPGLDALGQDGVVLVGHVEKAALAGLYASAAAFVYVPLAEGFGLPPLEAMRAGAPVLASDAVPSVVEHDGEAPALLVDPTDPDAIAAALVAITSDGALVARLRRSGPIFAGMRTWRSTAAGHLALWEAV
ncbi:MAG: glycosyltransferase family 4 protein, partial [Acidimicrobiales bacterium]